MPLFAPSLACTCEPYADTAAVIPNNNPVAQPSPLRRTQPSEKISASPKPRHLDRSSSQPQRELPSGEIPVFRFCPSPKATAKPLKTASSLPSQETQTASAAQPAPALQETPP